MNSEQIEGRVERKTDAADAALMSGRMTQAEYDAHMKTISRWAEEQYAKIKSVR